MRQNFWVGAAIIGHQATLLHCLHISVMDKVCEEYHKGHGIIVKSSLSYVKFCSNSDENRHEDRTEKIDTRLQEVTIEDVEDEDEDTAPLPLITDVKVHRENSLSSSKFSDKTSLKVSDKYNTSWEKSKDKLEMLHFLWSAV